MNDNERNNIYNNIFGNWKSIANNKYEGLEINISINEEELTLEIKQPNEEPKKIETSSSPYWFDGDFITFMDNRFYILKADELEMTFGEVETPGLFSDGMKWQLKFNRVQH